MKAQTRLASLKEQGINILVGFGIQFVANYFVLPLFGLHPSIADLFGMGAIFTVISVVRGYVIRRVMERKRARDVPPDFQHIIEEIAAERHRQIGGEGYSLDHDDELKTGEIARAAATYAYAAAYPGSAVQAAERGKCGQIADLADFIRTMWPWATSVFKPTSPRRNLIKAAALIVAQIGVYDRQKRRNHEAR